LFDFHSQADVIRIPDKLTLFLLGIGIKACLIENCSHTFTKTLKKAAGPFSKRRAVPGRRAQAAQKSGLLYLVIETQKP
jgi:hypothetical protein